MDNAPNYLVGCVIQKRWYKGVPVYEGNNLISSQGFALMKFDLETSKQRGIPIVVTSYMTAAGIGKKLISWKILCVFEFLFILPFNCL